MYLLDTNVISELRLTKSAKANPPFPSRILPVDTTIARHCAKLHVPDPRSERDALIAATAWVHRLIVVTRNIVDFAPVGVKLLNPWSFTAR